MNERPHLDQEIVRLMNTTKGYKINPPMASEMDIRKGTVLIGGIRTDFEPMHVLEDKLKMFVPKDFQSIPPEQVYKPEARPDLFLVGEGGAMQITLAHQTKQVANDAEVTAYKDEVKQVLKAMNAAIEWQHDGVVAIGDKQAVLLEFVTPMMNAKVYNLSFFTEWQQRVLTGSFICDQRKMKAWKPFFFQMIESIETNPPEAGSDRLR